MKPKPALFYEVRLVAGLAGLLPCLGLPVYAVLSRLLWGSFDTEAPLLMIGNAFEIILPLAAGLSAAHLMTIETEEDFDELRHSYPEPCLRLPLLRGGAALAFLLAAAAAGMAAFEGFWGPFTLSGLVAAALPSLAPALFLSELSLLIGGISRSYWVASGAVTVYWFLELQTRGQVSGPLFLFEAVWPVEGVPFALNRLLLAGLGLAFFVLNMVWFARPDIELTRRSPLG